MKAHHRGLAKASQARPPAGVRDRRISLVLWDLKQGRQYPNALVRRQSVSHPQGDVEPPPGNEILQAPDQCRLLQAVVRHVEDQIDLIPTKEFRGHWPIVAVAQKKIVQIGIIAIGHRKSAGTTGRVDQLLRGSSFGCRVPARTLVNAPRWSVRHRRYAASHAGIGSVRQLRLTARASGANVSA